MEMISPYPRNFIFAFLLFISGCIGCDKSGGIVTHGPDSVSSEVIVDRHALTIEIKHKDSITLTYRDQDMNESTVTIPATDEAIKNALKEPVKRMGKDKLDVRLKIGTEVRNEKTFSWIVKRLSENGINKYSLSN